MKTCPHCKMNLEVRNPSGFCDHLYYPDNCKFCQKIQKQKENPELFAKRLLLRQQKKAKRVLVTGDRFWSNRKIIARELGLCHSIEVLGQGGARGADMIACEWGNLILGPHNVETYKADWNRYGNPAGPIRNREMNKKFKPDFALAFHEDLSESKGTKDMVSVLLKAGIPVKVVSK